MSVPVSFEIATWRGTIPADPKREVIGMSLDIESGSVVRYALDLESARNLAETLLEYIAAHRARTAVQSPSSTGKPSLDVLPQDALNV